MSNLVNILEGLKHHNSVVSESTVLLKAIASRDAKALSKCFVKGDMNFGKHSKYYLGVIRGNSGLNFHELLFSKGLYVTMYCKDNSLMLLLRKHNDISRKVNYPTLSFVRYEFSDSDTAMTCHSDIASSKYSSLSNVLDESYDIISEYGGKAVEYHVGTEQGKSSASAGAIVMTALQDVISTWASVAYKGTENLPMLSECSISGVLSRFSKHKFPLLDVTFTYTFESAESLKKFSDMFISSLGTSYRVNGDSFEIFLGSNVE